jgi:probable F420-dependent oxidoreductase
MLNPGEIDVSISLSAELTVPGYLDVARTAAALGYRRVWMGETYKLDPLVFMTRVQSELPGLGIGIGPMPSLLRTGPQLAMAAATLHGLGVPGPIEMMVGASSPAMTDGWHGRGVATVAGMEALFRAARQAAAGERTDVDHPQARSHGFVNGLGPVELRLGLAALGPRMLHLAGRVADRAALNLCGVDQVPELVERVAAGAAEAGRPCPPVTVWVHCCVDPDDEAVAWGTRFLSGYVRAPGYRDAIAAQGFRSVVEAADAAGNARAIRSLIPREMLTAVLGFGRADEVRARLEAFRATGVEVAVNASLAVDRDGSRTLSAVAGRGTVTR